MAMLKDGLDVPAERTWILRAKEVRLGSERTFVVPRNIDFWTLHNCFFEAFGWSEPHFFDFKFSQNDYLSHRYMELSEMGDPWEDSGYWKYTLEEELVTAKKKKGVYVFDFMDEHWHKFTLLENCKGAPCWTCIKTTGVDLDPWGDECTPTADEVTARLRDVAKKNFNPKRKKANKKQIKCEEVQEDDFHALAMKIVQSLDIDEGSILLESRCQKTKKKSPKKVEGQLEFDL